MKRKRSLNKTKTQIQMSDRTRELIPTFQTNEPHIYSDASSSGSSESYEMNYVSSEEVGRPAPVRRRPMPSVVALTELFLY